MLKYILNSIILLILEKIGKDINYPYQIFIDLIKGIIRIKEIEFETIILNEQLTIENNTKNEIFLHLKNIETEIIRNDYLYKKMVKYVKQIYSMLEAFTKIRTKNDKSISEEYRILNKNIKHFEGYCRFAQSGTLTIVLIYVIPPEKEPLFQWAPLQGRGLKRKSQKPPIFFRFWYRGTRDDFPCCRP